MATTDTGACPEDRTGPRTLASDLRRLRARWRPGRWGAARASQALRGKARTTSTVRRVVLVALASLLPVAALSVVLSGALSRTATITSDLRDEVSAAITPVLTATDELGQASVLLDRFFASSAEHDRAAFAAHTRRVDAAFAPLRKEAAALGDDAEHLVDGAWNSWMFVRDTVVDPGFVVPADPQGRTGLLATLSNALNGVRSDLRGLSASASRHVADLAAQAQSTARWMQAGLVTGIALAAGLGLVTLLWLVRDLRRSIGALVEGARRMHDGAFEHRVDEDLPGDLAPVAQAFNAMARRIESQRRELHGLASNDGLTGLLNRRAFQDELEAEFERSTRYGHRAAVLLLDVDHFKAVNDTLGHPAGDAVLQAVAEQINACVRGVDRVGRWGGEEFAVLLPETEEEAARRVAERIVDLVARRTVVVGGERVNVTISVGVAVHDPLHGGIATADQLVDLADRALYEAKETGRNRACFATVPA